MKQGVSTEQLFQELQLMTEYLSAVKDPDTTFLRIHAEILLAHIDELRDQKLLTKAA